MNNPTKAIILCATIAAMMAGCSGNKETLTDDDNLGRLYRAEEIQGIVGNALSENAVSNSVEWCWAVVQDVETGNQLFAGGMVGGIHMGLFGEPWGSDMLSQDEMRKRLSDPAREIDAEIDVTGIKRDFKEWIYPVDYWECFNRSFCAKAAGFFPVDKPQYYAAVCIATPLIKGGEEAANAVARQALGRIVSGMRGDKSGRGPLCWYSMPCNANLLCNSGALELFAGETTEDSDFNKKAMEEDEESPLRRNSLFIHRRPTNGQYLWDKWHLLLTTGYNWRLADGMSEWCASRAQELKSCFFVEKAKFASDDRHIWLVCNTQSHTYFTICSYDWENHVFRVIGDGDTMDEQPDGTILVKNRKTYQMDENGNSLGAMWHDEWITPDGEVIRKSEPRNDLSRE